jgi:hypothetical protein
MESTIELPGEQRMTPEQRQDLQVENALLRGALWLAARSLKDYQEAPHFEIDDDGRPMLEVIVPPALRDKAADALARADGLLRQKEGKAR